MTKWKKKTLIMPNTGANKKGGSHIVCIKKKKGNFLWHNSSINMIILIMCIYSVTFVRVLLQLDNLKEVK